MSVKRNNPEKKSLSFIRTYSILSNFWEDFMNTASGALDTILCIYGLM